MNKQKSMEERVWAEQLAHEERDLIAESRRLKGRFPHVERYPSKKRLHECQKRYIETFTGKTILDYGCGKGEASLQYLAHGAIAYGIDIVPNYIAEAARHASDLGYPIEQFKFEVMDAHKLRYEEGTFDAVVGNGILHHLDPDIAMAEIYRVLKPGGRVLMQEPLADNPLLKLFRLLTPNARTEDERPFTKGDIARLTDNGRWTIETIYCGIVEAPVAMLTSIFLRKWPENWPLKTSDIVECLLHKHKMLLSWNQYILFNLVKKGVPSGEHSAVS